MEKSRSGLWRIDKRRQKKQTYRERVFVDRTTASGYNIRRIERPEHGCSLTGVDDKQKFIVSAEKYINV